MRDLPFELAVAWRHLRPRRGSGRGVVTALAVVGVALAVAFLVGGFSITAGFEAAFREKVLGVTAHVFVREYGVRFDQYREAEKKIIEVPGVRALAPMTFNEAMVSGRAGTQGGIVKGIDPRSVSQVLTLAQTMVSGSLEALDVPLVMGVRPVVLGAELARRVGATTGDYLTLVSPLRSADPEAWNAQARTPTSGNFQVVGVFEAGFHEYDSRLVLLTLADARAFFGLGDTITGFEVAVDDPARAGEVADAIRERLGEDFSVMDWRRQNRNLFTSLIYQRVAILVVLSVMVVLASCLVSIVLVMLVMERHREIAILKAMGATPGRLMRIFLAQGLYIGVTGTVLGVVLAFIFCEGLLSRGIALDPKVYGIARLPVVFDALDYALAATGAVCVTALAAVIPAWRGARLDPVEGLRVTHGE
jgi:lipoprotein-releasing system permease protein